MERISILKTKFPKHWTSLPSQCIRLAEQTLLQSLAKHASDLLSEYIFRLMHVYFVCQGKATILTDCSIREMA
jgi:hypothetical protein